MTGHERHDQFINIVDVPISLFNFKIAGLADNGVFVDGKGLVLPVKQVAGGLEDSLAFVGLGSEDGYVQIEAVPGVSPQLVKGHEHLVVVLASVVGIAVFRLPPPVHLQLEIGRLGRSSLGIVGSRRVRHGIVRPRSGIRIHGIGVVVLLAVHRFLIQIRQSAFFDKRPAGCRFAI